MAVYGSHGEQWMHICVVLVQMQQIKSLVSVDSSVSAVPPCEYTCSVPCWGRLSAVAFKSLIGFTVHYMPWAHMPASHDPCATCPTWCVCAYLILQAGTGATAGEQTCGGAGQTVLEPPQAF
jgi:hypothetical protein